MNPRWHVLDRSFGRRPIAWEFNLAPGLIVRHCGHPTARFPYNVDGLRALGAFRALADAQVAAELALSATLRDRNALASESTCSAIRRQALGLAS